MFKVGPARFARSLRQGNQLNLSAGGIARQVLNQAQLQ
jgi:hypothetical protein